MQADDRLTHDTKSPIEVNSRSFPMVPKLAYRTTEAQGI